MLTVRSALAVADEETGMVRATVSVENSGDSPEDFIFNQSLPAMIVNQGVGIYSVTVNAMGPFELVGIGDYICAVSSYTKPLAGAYRFRLTGTGGGKARGSTNTVFVKAENAQRPYVAHAVRIPPNSSVEISLQIDVRA
jgi:hypothetical protein